MKQKILNRLGELIEEADKMHNLAIELETTKANLIYAHQEENLFLGYRISVLSFLSTVIGRETEYYKAIESQIKRLNSGNTTLLRQILTKVRYDVEYGWLDNIKGIISAEIFSNFLEMAEYLIEENYKDPAAVIIGSVLENNIKAICEKHGIATFVSDAKSNKLKPLKADFLNAELAKSGVYNALIQKGVTTWLDLRNKAAHGQYDGYDVNQVKQMLSFAIDFGGKYI